MRPRERTHVSDKLCSPVKGYVFTGTLCLPGPTPSAVPAAPSAGLGRTGKQECPRQGWVFSRVSALAGAMGVLADRGSCPRGES